MSFFSSTRRLVQAAITVTAFAVAPAAISAQTISFSHVALLGSGSLDGVLFSDKSVSISASGSLANRQSYASGFFIDHEAASITIEGVGPVSLTGTRSYVNTTTGVVGFADLSGRTLFEQDPNLFFFLWDMTSSIGPVIGLGEFQQWDDAPVVTSGGTLRFDDMDVFTVFEAEVGTPVPEPSSLALLAVGGLWMLRRRAARWNATAE